MSKKNLSYMVESLLSVSLAVLFLCVDVYIYMSDMYLYISITPDMKFPCT
jgi:hypothetical protein